VAPGVTLLAEVPWQKAALKGRCISAVELMPKVWSKLQIIHMAVITLSQVHGVMTLEGHQSINHNSRVECEASYFDFDT
jgi:hypothetical protein